MAFNLTPKIKDIFDIVRTLSSYLSIAGTAFLIFFIFTPQTDFSWIPEWLKIILQIIAVLILLSPIIIYFSDTIYLRYIIRRGNLSTHIIECQEVLIDIYHQRGKKANIYQKVFFHKISNKNKNPYYTSLNFSGRILTKTIQTLNCSHSLDPQHSTIKVSYINNMGKLNKYKNIFRENDKFLMLYFTVKDAFILEEESWEMNVSNLCQDYNLEILVPKGKKIQYAKFIRNNSNEIVQNIQPLVIKQEDRFKIILRVMNFDKHESFKVIWKYY